MKFDAETLRLVAEKHESIQPKPLPPRIMRRMLRLAKRGETQYLPFFFHPSPSHELWLDEQGFRVSRFLRSGQVVIRWDGFSNDPPRQTTSVVYGGGVNAY